MSEFEEVGERALELGARFLVVAAVVAGAVVLSRLTSPLVRRIVARRGRPSRTRVFTTLYRVLVVVVGSLSALTLAFPSVRVADVLGIFGILSVAAGFAFKDTFENLLAGVLLLLRDPFQSGDQVVLGEVEGTVEGVTARETQVRGHDGRLFHVPNAEVMRGVITVETDAALRRQTVVLRLPAHSRIAQARAALMEALHTAPGVEAVPPSQVVLVDIEGGDVVLECRFWTSSRRSRATGTRDEVIESILAGLAGAGIDLPVDEVLVTLPAGEAERPAPRRAGRDGG